MARQHVTRASVVTWVLVAVGLRDHKAGLSVDAGQHRVLCPGDAVLAGGPAIRKI